MRIVFTNPENTEGFIEEGGTMYAGPIPPKSSEAKLVYDRVVAAGTIAEEFSTQAAQFKRTAKADIWRRATDDEASQIAAGLDALPLRKRRIYDDATYLDHSDPMFSELASGFRQTFGEQRATELLAPSV